MTQKENPVLLFVDDSPTIRKMMIAVLRGAGVAYLEAGSGLEAIEQLALQTVDLIFLDIHMPDMHGLEFLRFVRQHPRFSQIPVVVVTSRDGSAARQEALEAGATLYLTKPFTPEQIQQAAQRCLQAGGAR